MITLLRIDELHDKDFLDMGEMFFQEGRLPGKFNRGTFANNWRQILEQGRGVIFVKRAPHIVGAIAGVIAPDICDGALVASEFFWFIHPEHRNSTDVIRLWRQFEAWAISCGARRMSMSLIFGKHTTRLRRLYMSMGFRAVDVSYFREL